MTYKYKLQDSTEIETTILIPKQYEGMIEDLRLLQRDGQNPNKMTDKQKESVWKSLSDFNWIYPIITNKDGLLTDGEQRVDTCLEHSEFYGPVLRLPIQDVNRRILRQVLNKLKGTHDKLLDAQEFQRIREADGEENLKALLGITNRALEQYDKLLDAANSSNGDVLLDHTFQVVIACTDEAEQKQIFEELQAGGYKVSVLTL